jgi:hypothetical protein
MHIKNSNDLYNTVISISKKIQKQKNSSNFFFSPTLDIELHHARVWYIDFKTMVFIFNKSENLNLYLFLQNISKTLLTKTEYYAKQITYSSSFGTKTKFNFLSNRNSRDKNDLEILEFTIKCFIPPSIKLFHEQKEVKYQMPLKGNLFDKITLNIKNIWEDPTRIGFNIEVKELHVDR